MYSSILVTDEVRHSAVAHSRDCIGSVWKSGFRVFRVVKSILCESLGRRGRRLSHQIDDVFTAGHQTGERSVRRNSMCTDIRDLSSDAVFHGDSENMSCVVELKYPVG